MTGLASGVVDRHLRLHCDKVTEFYVWPLADEYRSPLFSAIEERVAVEPLAWLIYDYALETAEAGRLEDLQADENCVQRSLEAVGRITAVMRNPSSVFRALSGNLPSSIALGWGSLFSQCVHWSCLAESHPGTIDQFNEIRFHAAQRNLSLPTDLKESVVRRASVAQNFFRNYGKNFEQGLQTLASEIKNEKLGLYEWTILRVLKGFRRCYYGRVDAGKAS